MTAIASLIVTASSREPEASPAFNAGTGASGQVRTTFCPPARQLLLYRSSAAATATICCPSGDDGAIWYGSWPGCVASRLSASMIDCTMADASAPFARLSFAAISWSARIRLASPFAGIPRIVSRSLWLYVREPSGSEVTGHAEAWFFQ